MIVVADASPLVALALCESLEVLEKLFGTIKVSRSVYEEVTVHDKPKADVLKVYLQEKVVDTDLGVGNQRDFFRQRRAYVYCIIQTS